MHTLAADGGSLSPSLFSVTNVKSRAQPARFEDIMKAIKIACVAALVSSLFAAQANAEEYTFATEPTFPPFEFTDSQHEGEIIGYEIDLVKAIGRVEGFEAKFVSMPFDAILPAVMGGVQDAAASGITKNEARLKKVDFTDGHYVAGQTFMIHRDDLGKYKKMDDLKGHKVCVQIGSVGAEIAKELGDVESVVFNSMPEAYIELKKKGCVAAITGDAVQAYYLKTTGDQDLVHVEESKVNAKELGMIVRKGNTELLNKLNDGIAKLKASGEYQEIYDKWFGGEQ